MATDPYSSPLAFFGAELKRLRERAGMTQSDVAKQTIHALSTVSAYETGTRIPSADFAQRADKVFGTVGQSENDEGDLTRLQNSLKISRFFPGSVTALPWNGKPKKYLNTSLIRCRAFSRLRNMRVRSLVLSGRRYRRIPLSARWLFA